MSFYALNKLMESKIAFTLLLFSSATFVTAITFKTKTESYKTLYLTIIVYIHLTDTGFAWLPVHLLTNDHSLEIL
jgi:hypothetical protein